MSRVMDGLRRRLSGFRSRQPTRSISARCKYNVLKIERNESRGGGPFGLRGTDYYSPDLKLVIAREYREGAANANLIKFDRISPIKP